jgi:AcrR family transcriptional regulator
MNKKLIQEERIKSYFISAAKELIRAEGIEVVSARNVADRAGYSYATLYNYFKDIRDLIFSCAQGFMEECHEFVIQDIAQKKDGAEKLKTITINYTRFFIQYPGIFEILYQHKLSSIATPDSKIENVYTFFDSLTENDWQELSKQNGFSLSQIEIARKNHKLALHGLLLFYLNRRMTIDYSTLMKEIANINASFIAGD